MASMVKYGTGIVCVSMKEEGFGPLATSFDGESGGESREASDCIHRDCGCKAWDNYRPGHIFPLKYREGGVLKRAGHTEASVDLAVLAGLEPVAVLCKAVDDDGSMARLPKLRECAQRENSKNCIYC
ncbi:hypothetical protein NL676_039629 [Syzygium grande]|nr:hypothetical protein NL676_039629 [Syzygium grande]